MFIYKKVLIGACFSLLAEFAVHAQTTGQNTGVNTGFDFDTGDIESGNSGNNTWEVTRCMAGYTWNDVLKKCIEVKDPGIVVPVTTCDEEEAAACNGTWDSTTCACTCDSSGEESCLVDGGTWDSTTCTCEREGCTYMERETCLNHGQAIDPETCECIVPEEPDTCEQTPNCSDIGFKYTASECGTLDKIKCPFDDRSYFCSVNTNCPSGYVTENASCPSGQTKDTSTVVAAGLKVCYKCGTTSVTCPDGYNKQAKAGTYHFQGQDTQYASDGKTKCYKLVNKCNDHDIVTYYEKFSKIASGTYLQCSNGRFESCRTETTCDSYNYGSITDGCLTNYVALDPLTYVGTHTTTTGTSYSCNELKEQCKEIMPSVIEELEAYNSACSKKLAVPSLEINCNSGVADGNSAACVNNY